MNESQKQLLEDWFGLSEEELFEIIMMEDSSEEQMENAIIVLEEKFGYTQEGIIDYAKEKIGQGIDYAKKHPFKAARNVALGIGGVYAAKKLGAGEVLGNMLKVAKNNANPFKKDYVVRSLDDFLPGMEHPSGREDAARKAADDEKEKKANQPLKFINKKQNESITGTPKMQKTFMQFREELTEEIFIEDLNNESLAYIIESEEYDEETVLESIAELIYREVISEGDVANIMQSKNFSEFGSNIKKSLSNWKGFSGKVGDPNVGKPVSSAPKPTTTFKSSPDAPIKKDNRTAAQKLGVIDYGKKTTGTLPGGRPAGKSNLVGYGNVKHPVDTIKQGAKPSSAPKPSSIPNKPEVSKKSVASSQPKQAAKPVKPTTPVKKSIPSANKPSAAMNDLRQSVDKLRGTASAAATATNRAKTALSKVPGTGRMNKPTSRGGMSSSDIHSAIGKLGGEPTRATPRSTPTLKVPAQTRQGAPRASSSKPPAGGKWM